MPYVSKAQERWAFATHQPFAEEWARMTDQSKLPAHASPLHKKNHKKKSKGGRRD